MTEFMETIHFLCWNCEMVLHKKWPIFQHKSSVMSEQTFSEGARLETLTSKTLLNKSKLNCKENTDSIFLADAGCAYDNAPVTTTALKDMTTS